VCDVKNLVCANIKIMSVIFAVNVKNSMDYGLLKQLEECGFPFNKIYEPTLDELIEECGGESLIVLTVGKEMVTALHGKSGISCSGKTARIALGQLYLTLNSK